MADADLLKLAAARFWRDPARRFVATHAETDELFDAESDIAHALVLALSQLPSVARSPFAARFFANRREHDAPTTDLAVAAFAVLQVLPLTGRADLHDPRIVDLLEGAAQGDDPSLTPEPALVELRKAIARIRLDLALDDDEDPAAAASIAFVETLDPSGGVVDLREVLRRVTWAALRTWEPERVLELLLELDARASARS